MQASPHLDKISDEMSSFYPVLYVKADINFYFSEGICQFNNRYLKKRAEAIHLRKSTAFQLYTGYNTRTKQSLQSSMFCLKRQLKDKAGLQIQKLLFILSKQQGETEAHRMKPAHKTKVRGRQFVSGRFFVPFPRDNQGLLRRWHPQQTLMRTPGKVVTVSFRSTGSKLMKNPKYFCESFLVVKMTRIQKATLSVPRSFSMPDDNVYLFMWTKDPLNHHQKLLSGLSAGIWETWVHRKPTGVWETPDIDGHTEPAVQFTGPIVMIKQASVPSNCQLALPWCHWCYLQQAHNHEKRSCSACSSFSP